MITRRRLRYLLSAVLIVAAVGGGVAVRSVRVRVAYHDWQMHRAYDRTFAEPDTFHPNGLVSYTLGETHRRYEYHRQQLVRLGAVRELHYRMRHLGVPTDESRHFMKVLFSWAAPKCIDWKSNYPPDLDVPEPLTLTVWCYSADASAWDALVAAYDVADYRSRYLEDAAK